MKKVKLNVRFKDNICERKLYISGEQFILGDTIFLVKRKKRIIEFIPYDKFGNGKIIINEDSFGLRINKLIEFRSDSILHEDSSYVTDIITGENTLILIKNYHAFRKKG